MTRGQARGRSPAPTSPPPPPPPPVQEQPKRQPEFSVRYGEIKGTVWANEYQQRLMYSVVLERIYKDAQGQWKKSPSIDERSMLAASRVLELCWDEIQLRKGGGLKLPEGSGQNGNGGGVDFDQLGGDDGLPPF